MKKNYLWRYPLTNMQQSMLSHSMFGKQPGVYLIQAKAMLNEYVNVGLLQQAWDHIITRHELLRASIDTNDGEMSLIINRQAQYPIKFIDLSQYNVTEKQNLLNKFLVNDRAEGFNFKQAALMRLFLIKLDEDQYCHIWTHHHIISSGALAIKVLLEVLSLYDAVHKNEQLQLSKVDSYQKFIDYLQELNVIAAKDYWQKLLVGFSMPTQLLIPFNHNVSSQMHSAETVTMSPELSAKLKKMSRQYHLTSNVIIQGAWGLLLSKYSSSSDIVFGIVRALPVTVIKNMVGPFINTLPIRVKINAANSVVDYLATLRQQHIALKRFANTSLYDIQRWISMDNGVELFNTLIDFQHESINSHAKRIGGDGWQQREFDYTLDTHYLLTLMVYGEQDKFDFKLHYDASIYTSEIVRQLLRHLLSIIENFIAFPNRKIMQIKYLTENEQNILLRKWNNTAVDYPRDKNLAQLFEEQAQKTPQKIALTFGDEHFTYQQLNQRANQLAHYLQQQEVMVEDLVPICFERNLDMIIAILAILKVGAAYVPMDADFPASRINYILRDTVAKMVLTQQSLVKKISDSLNGCNVSIVLVGVESTCQVDNDLLQNFPNKASPHNLAYVIYTSGSTGKPKGVLVEHFSAVNCVFTTRDLTKVGDQDKFLAVTSLTFDVSVLDYFLPFALGAEVVIADQIERKDGMQLLDLLRHHQITAMQATPGVWSMLLSCQWHGADNFKIVTAGEPLADKLAEKLQTCGQIFNIYGPTEATIYTSFKHVQAGQKVTIGKPMGNIKTYILDKNLQPVPVGVAGELYIGGVGVARGYLKRPDLTESKFINDPFSDNNENAKLYATGDLVRWLPNGEIEFIERIDNQVKMRGYRIELGEIENNLLNCPPVKRCAVIVREDGTGAKTLIAYLTVKENQVIDVMQVRQFLANILPEYMIPVAFHVLSEFPLTSSGKIDRKNLLQIKTNLLTNNKQPDNEVEKKIVDLICKVIKCDSIDVERNFFEIGVHSLMVLQLCNLLNQQFKIRLRPVDLFTYHSVRLLAEYIDHKSDENLYIAAIQQRVTKKRQRAYKNRNRVDGKTGFNRYTGNVL